VRRAAVAGAWACAAGVLVLGAGGPTREPRASPPHTTSPTAAALERGVAFAPAGPRLAELAIGRSAHGRRLMVTAFGSERAWGRVLVVGCIHGTECAGIAVARRIVDGCPPVDADVWIAPDLNPDGHRLGTRLNGRGVDLNRNFPSGWRRGGSRGDPEYPGPRPFSEPETRVARDLVGWLRPAVTVWYHQGEGPYVRAWGPSIPAARRYARAAGLRFRALPWLAGTAPQWQNRTFPGRSSFVVELPAGRLTDAQAQRHAAAVELLAGYRGENRAAVGGSGVEGS
jgi:protein MpaA